LLQIFKQADIKRASKYNISQRINKASHTRGSYIESTRHTNKPITVDENIGEHEVIPFGKYLVLVKKLPVT